jgi:hypothetical protein
MELILRGHTAFELGSRFVAHGFKPATGKEGNNHAQSTHTVALIFWDRRPAKAPLAGRRKASDVGKAFRAGKAETLP